MRPAPTVLIVEDDYLLLAMLADLCERSGVAVASASSGEAALTLLRARGAQVDWLFTDINLPGLIDGWTVADAYRALRPGGPVVYASTSRRGEARLVPGSLFLQKPLQMREVAELVRMMAGQPSQAPAEDQANSARADGSARHAATRAEASASGGCPA